MTLPADATKEHLDQGTDDPKQARAELAANVDTYNLLLAHLALSGITKFPLTVGNGLRNASNTSLAAKALAAGGIQAPSGGIQLHLNGLAEESAILDGDFLGYYDVSAGLHKKIQKSDLVAAPTADEGTSLVLLASYSPSVAPSVDITSVLTSTYKRFRVEVYDFVPVTDDVTLLLRTSTDNGSSFDSGASDYRYVANVMTDAGANPFAASTGATAIAFSGAGSNQGVGSAAGEHIALTLEIYNPLGTTLRKFFRWSGTYVTPTPRLADINGSGARWGTEADIDAIQLLFDSGNIESGEVRVYGVKDA